MTSLPDRAEERQLGAAVAAALLLGGTTVLCRLPWTAVLPGGLLGTAYYYIMYRLGRRTPLPVQQAARLVCGNHIARFLSVLSAGVLALLAGWITGRSVAVFSDLRQAHWAGLGVLALAAVAAQRGTAVTLRCASVLLVPLAAALAFAEGINPFPATKI